MKGRGCGERLRPFGLPWASLRAMPVPTRHSYGVSLVLAHPFRLSGAAVAVVDDGSEQGVAQLVAMLLSTRKGERPLRPGYGITDPVFSRMDLAEINAGLTMFGPAVEVVAIDVQQVDASNEQVTVRYASGAAS